MWSLIALAAVTLTAIQLFPQLYQSLKTKKVRDLSLGFGILVGSGCLVWLIYGIHIRDWAVIVANSINLLGAIILIYLKIKN